MAMPDFHRGNQPGYDAYLDDPNDFTTGFGYGVGDDADTPANDAPDIDDLEMEQLVNDGIVSDELAEDGLVRDEMVRGQKVRLGPDDAHDPIPEV